MRTHRHAVKENIKVFIHGTDIFIDRQIKRDPFFLIPAAELCCRYGVIHSVMHVKQHGIFFPDPASAHICFICYDQCSGDRICSDPVRLIRFPMRFSIKSGVRPVTAIVKRIIFLYDVQNPLI